MAAASQPCCITIRPALNAGLDRSPACRCVIHNLRIDRSNCKHMQGIVGEGSSKLWMELSRQRSVDRRWIGTASAGSSNTNGADDQRNRSDGVGDQPSTIVGMSGDDSKHEMSRHLAVATHQCVDRRIARIDRSTCSPQACQSRLDSIGEPARHLV